MAIDIFVTLDTFLWNWDQPNTGEIWLCVQPHVADLDALTEWVNNSATGSNFNYQLVTKDCNPQIPYIPVSFPSNSNLTLKLYNSLSPTATAFKTITNNRRDGVVINDVEAFRRANVEEASSLTHFSPTSSNIRDMAPGPFAVSYNGSVRDAFTATGNREQLANMLTLAFWGGKPRRLPRAAADRLNLVNLMELPGVSADLLLTNLHSLNGLMFMVGTKAQIGELAAIKRIEITGDLPNGSTIEIVKKTDDNVIKNFTAYFGKLAAANIQPPHTLVKSSEINNFGNRMYVIDNLVPFSPVKTENEIWFQRRSESENLIENSRLSNLRRMVVHLKNTDDGNEPTLNEYEKLKNLNWTVYQTFDAQLIPYRKANVIAELSPDKKAPLRLIPAKQISRLFYEEVRNACSGGQIDGLGIDIFDKAGKKLQLDLINCYQFPWDQISQVDNQIDPNVFTLLYYGAKPESGEVIVRIKRPLFAENQIQDFLVTKLQYPPPRQENLWGFRLEATDLKEDNGQGSYLGKKLSSFTFNTLICSPGEGVEPEDFRRLVGRFSPALGFARDLRFEFAQSVSRIETLVEVAYPTYKLQEKPEDTDPEQDYRNDLVNHNAIDSRIQWAARLPELLSDKGQIFSVGAVKDGIPCQEETVKQYFRIAHRFAVSPKPVTIGQPFNVRSFFNELFRDAGVSRSLFSNLEHTYGTKFDIGELKDSTGEAKKLKSHFDYPVTLAPEVKITKAQDPAQTCNLPNDSALLTVKYKKPETGAGEKAILTFNHELLKETLFQQEKCRAIYIESWRAIAELAWAKTIIIRGLFYSFDINEAAKNHSSGQRNFNLSDAIKILPDGDWKIDATARIKPKCREWLESTSGQITNSVIEIDLPPLNGKPVGEACHVFELLFEIERIPEKIPAINSDWQLKRATPLRDTLEGQKFIDDNSASTKTLRDEYLRSLKNRKVKLPLPETEKDKSEKFKNLVGERDISESPDGNSSWIVPFEISPPTSPEKVTAGVCPLTFLPLKRDNYLGDLTTALLRKYFKVLGQVLELGVPGEWKNWKTSEWKIYFDRLNEYLVTDAAPLSNLISKLIGIAVPIPPEQQETTPVNNCHSPAGTVCRLNPEVKKIIAEFNKNEQSPTPLQNTWKKWLRNRLLLNPALFDEAKAFLYTNLRGETENKALNKDFCQMVSQKLLYEDIQISNPNATSPTTAIEYFMYRQGFLDLLGSSQSEKWFGFLEILDDVRYDNEFRFNKFELRSFEDVIEQINEAGEDRPSRIALVNNALNLPFGQYIKQNQQNECSFVRLASRSTLVNPIHIFTDKLKSFQPDTGFDGLVKNNLYSYEKFRNNLGSFEAPANDEPTLRFAAKSASFKRSERLDDYVLTAVFVIKANEEFEQSVIEAFETDTFYINQLENIPPPEAPVPTTVSPEVQTVFNALSQNQQTVQLEKPFELLNPQVLNFVRDAIKAVSTEPTAVPKNNQFCIVKKDGKDIIKFSVANTPVEAALFEFFDTKPANQNQKTDKFLLLVNMQVEIWKDMALGLVQERNVSDEFAKAFQQTSLLSTSEQKYQPILAIDLSQERQDLPLTLPSRTLSAAELVRLALRLNGKNLLTNMDAWREFDLSITIFHHQETFIRSLFLVSQGNQEIPAQDLKPIFGKSLFPLQTRYIGKNATSEQNKPILWFDNKYKNFSVEFQWSSQSNLQFFRVQNFYVQLKD